MLNNTVGTKKTVGQPANAVPLAVLACRLCFGGGEGRPSVELPRAT
jgi:hypothetical protein